MDFLILMNGCFSAGLTRLMFHSTAIRIAMQFIS